MKRIIWIFSFLLVVLSPYVPSLAYSVEKKSESSANAVVAQTVNINKADAHTLSAVLSGVGMKRAESIVAFRKKHGLFKNIEELKQVKGIGESILHKNKGKIRL